MSNLRKSFLAFIAGLFFVILTPWLHQTNKETKLNMMPIQLNALIENMHWIEFDEQGDIAQEYFSPKLESLPDQQGYHITQPLLKLSKNQERWEIQAKFAHAQQALELVELKQNVEIKHFKDPNQQPSTMKTHSLNYHPKEKRADTQELVAILFQDSVIQSQGLNAYFDPSPKIYLTQVSGKIHTQTF